MGIIHLIKNEINSLKSVILYIGGFNPPDGNAAALRVICNAKILREIGYEVVLAGMRKRTSSFKSIESRKLKIQDFTTYLTVYPNSLLSWGKHLTSISNVKDIIDQIGSKKIKAIIAYNYPSIALERLLKYCKNHSIKLISDCTEWAQIENPKGIRTFIKNWDTKRRMEKIHPKLDGIITISDYLNNYYKQLMTPVLKLPPLIDKKDPKWSSSETNALKDKVQLIYAGSPGNGGKDRIDKIIEALSKIDSDKVKPFELIVIGITKEQYLFDFNKKHIPTNLKDKVLFKGRLPHKETIKAIKDAHYSIFIRDKNIVNTAGFPTKFVESISCGTPVLTNKTSNISEYLKEEELGYFLDISSDKSLESSMSRAINICEKKILLMKQKCRDTNIFNILDKESDIRKFFEEIFFKANVE